MSYDSQNRNWHKARLPSVCEVRTRVEPTLTHKMGFCFGGTITLKLLDTPPVGTAVSLQLDSQPASALELSLGLNDFRIFPEESHARTLPSMLPVTSVSGAYSCKCRLFITLLSWHSCHRICCFLVEKQEGQESPQSIWTAIQIANALKLRGQIWSNCNRAK